MENNEVLKNMNSRFSCRRFKPDAVEKEKLEAVIEAAKHAASGHNLQAWHFTVISTEQGKKSCSRQSVRNRSSLKSSLPKAPPGLILRTFTELLLLL